MELTGAMRVWAVGQLLLAVDVAAGSGWHLAEQSVSPDAVAGTAPALAAALTFFVIPMLLLLGFGRLRGYWWGWLLVSLPAIAWVPALPFVLLVYGPPLDSPAGLALAGLGIIGAVIAVVAGLLAALDARRAS